MIEFIDNNKDKFFTDVKTLGRKIYLYFIVALKAMLRANVKLLLMMVKH